MEMPFTNNRYLLDTVVCCDALRSAIVAIAWLLVSYHDLQASTVQTTANQIQQEDQTHRRRILGIDYAPSSGSSSTVEDWVKVKKAAATPNCSR